MLRVWFPIASSPMCVEGLVDCSSEGSSDLRGSGRWFAVGAMYELLRLIIISNGEVKLPLQHVRGAVKKTVRCGGFDDSLEYVRSKKSLEGSSRTIPAQGSRTGLVSSALDDEECCHERGYDCSCCTDDNSGRVVVACAAAAVFVALMAAFLIIDRKH